MIEADVLRDLAALSLTTIGLASILGALANRGLGVFLLGGGAAISGALCCAGFSLFGWTGLAAGVLLASGLGYWLGSRFGKRRGGLFTAALWLGYCGACAIGYWAAGWIGWLTITLPALLLFWYGLWRFSGRILPLEIEKRPRWLRRYVRNRILNPRQVAPKLKREQRDRQSAFRSLLTYSFGTNYPYAVVDKGVLVERVGGNPYGRFLAGPGIVLTEPHQAVVISDGMKIKKIASPGLVFTGLFDVVGQDHVIDLRTQLRMLDLEATTTDGIRMQARALVSFRIHRPDLPAGKFWADQASTDAVFEAIRARPVEEKELKNWDDLVPMVATRILREIVSNYRCDELCAADQPDWLPDEELPFGAIGAAFKEDLRRQMKSICSGIEILDAGLTSLQPVDRDVRQWRIENWRTGWMRKMAQRVGEGATEAMRLTSQARAQGQAEVIRILAREAEDMGAEDKDLLADVLTLRLLGAIEEMARGPVVQQLLPPEATETMRYLRQAVGRGRPDRQGRGPGD